MGAHRGGRLLGGCVEVAPLDGAEGVRQQPGRIGIETEQHLALAALDRVREPVPETGCGAAHRARHGLAIRPRPVNRSVAAGATRP